MSVDPARLTAVPLFASLTDDQRAAVAAKLEERTADVGDHLSTEGGAGYFFFVIDSGGATVTRQSEVLAEFGPGDSSARLPSSRRAQDRDRHGDVTHEAVCDVRSRLRQAGGRHPRAARGDRRRALAARLPGWRHPHRERVPHVVEPLGHDPPPDPAATLLADDQPGVRQHLRVVADRGLRLAQRLEQVARADLVRRRRPG